MKVSSPDPDRHLNEVSRLVSEEFAGGEQVEEIGRKYFRECHYDWNASRLIWEQKELVHHWGVWGYQMRLGSTRLKSAGVGAVVTREGYRGRGLMGQAAEASLQAMSGNGYDLSILRGRHYARYGYVRAWNYITYRIEEGDLPDYPLQKNYEILGRQWMDSIVELYNIYHEAYAGTAVRPTYTMLDEEDMQAFGWFDADQRLEGYVRAVPDTERQELQCLEAAGDPQQALAVLSDLMGKQACISLTFFTLPFHHPLLRVLRQGAVIVEERFFDQSGWWVRIIDLKTTLRKMVPMLEERILRSGFANWQGVLALDGERQCVGLEFDRGQVSLASAASSKHELRVGSSLARLIIGSDHPDEILRQAGGEGKGKGLELAEVLFPRMHPVLSHWDEF